MSFLKPRYESDELKIMRSLNIRSNLSSKELTHFINLEKGFIGEQLFDTYLEGFSNCLILNDLLFERNGSVFQIDSLLLSKEITYLFDVKNYDSDYYIESDRWYTILGKEVKDPLDQLKRCNLLLQGLLKDLGYNTPIKPYLVFVNPEFTLYQAPLNQPIIFPTQLNRFMNKLKINLSTQTINGRHAKLAERLLEMHISVSPYKRIPEYTFEQLKKGIFCASCYSLHTGVHGEALVCHQCGHKENITSAVLRSVEEIKLLFPERKMTTNLVYEWCGVVSSKKTIRRILSRNFRPIGHGNNTYYKDVQE